MAKYIVDESALASIANGIRQKTGSSSQMIFPSGFVDGIGTLTKTSDANATASDIKSGKTAYVNGTKIIGTAKVLLSTKSSVLQKMTAISKGSHADGDKLISIAMPDDELLIEKSSLTSYGFEVYNVNQQVNYTSHFKIGTVTFKTIGGVNFVNTIQIVYSGYWTVSSAINVYVVIKDSRVYLSIG